MELQKNELFDIFVLYLAEAYKRVAEVDAAAKKEFEEKGETELKTPLPTVVSIGSTRSGKTVAIAQGIALQVIQSEAKGKPLIVNCYRDLLTDCATKTYNDFVLAFRLMGIEEKCHFTAGNKPAIKYGKSRIAFLGVSDELEVQQAACDIAFFNEAFEITNRRFVRQVVSRCKKLVVYDGNPTDSLHWLFDEMKGNHVKVFHSIYKDNKFLTPSERHSIEQYCPWDLKDFKKVNGRWQWLKPENEREPNKENILMKTASRYDWLVKGEGIPSEREGVVYKVSWVDKLPPISLFEDIGFGLDFGWSGDETAFVLMGNIGNKLYIKKLIYETLRGSTAEDKLLNLHSQIASILNRPHTDYFEAESYDDNKSKEENERIRILRIALAEEFCTVVSEEKLDIDSYTIYITCETQDNYKDVKFVTGLKNLAYEDGLDWLGYYKISPKPRKYKAVANLQAWDLVVVKDSDMEREINNFTYRMIGDKASTILEENKKVANNYDHAIDASHYVGYDRFRKI